ncbi:Rrp15p [Cryptosporidium tyzzeri]|nr:Rrp15p [Cryptosporidium tyzzeri]
MKKTQISNVASGILSRSVLKGDPVFSQEDFSNRKIIKNESKKHSKRNANKNILNTIFLKPTAKNQREKSLKQLATKGVVKFFNMIVNYQENSNIKASKGTSSLKNAGYCTETRKVKNVESNIKPNRFGTIVGMHSDR